MANYCFTTFHVEGQSAFLEKLSSLIGEGKDAVDIFEELGFPLPEEDDEAEDFPYWHSARLDSGVLTFREEAKWEMSRCIWTLRDKVNTEGDPKIGDIFYYASVAESFMNETNDAEGKHFPYRISVYCVEEDPEEDGFHVVDDDTTFLFRSEKEMLDFFREKKGWDADSVEEVEEMAQKNNHWIDIEEINVVPGPTNLGINRMKFTFSEGEDGVINANVHFKDQED